MEPPQLPKGPYGTNARGDAPSQKRNAHQRRKPSGKTLCKRGDNATGANNETDANKRRRARSGHSQRAAAKPTAKAYKATTKKERATPTWPPTEEQTQEKVTDPVRGRTKQRGKNFRWLAASEREQQAHRQPKGARRTDRLRRKPHPKEKAPSLKGNLQTESVMWTWKQTYGQGCTKEREAHPERGHKRQQGAKLSNRPRHQPQPAEKRVGYERPPQTASKGWGGNT